MQVKAVEFGAAGGFLQSGFAAQQLDFAGQRAGGDRMVAEGNRVSRNRRPVMHHDMSTAGVISFDIEWRTQTPACVSVNLFARDWNEAAGRVSFLILRTGESEAMIQSAVAVAGELPVAAGLPIRNEVTHVQFVITRDKIDVVGERQDVVSFAYDRDVDRGKGLKISVQAAGPMGMGAIGMGEEPEQRDLLKISNMRIATTPSSLTTIPISSGDKSHILTIPRFRKQSPATEILVGRNGDLLRGRLISLTTDSVNFLSRLDELSMPRKRLAGIIWLSADDPQTDQPLVDGQPVRIVFGDTTVLRMHAEKIVDGVLVGRHAVLGSSAIPLSMIHELEVGELSERVEVLPLADWTSRPAAEPHFDPASPGGSGNAGSGTREFGTDSPLVGTNAGELTAGLLDGGQFVLRNHADKIVILDFWATWCVPCVRAMPDTMKTVADFPADKVILLAVNQQENPDIVLQFLENRDWNVRVALDPEGAVGKRFAVDAIPQLVVIAPGGKIDCLHVGSAPDLQMQLRQVVQRLLKQTPAAGEEPR